MTKKKKKEFNGTLKSCHNYTALNRDWAHLVFASLDFLLCVQSARGEYSRSASQEKKSSRLVVHSSSSGVNRLFEPALPDEGGSNQTIVLHRAAGGLPPFRVFAAEPHLPEGGLLQLSPA